MDLLVRQPRILLQEKEDGGQHAVGTAGRRGHHLATGGILSRHGQRVGELQSGLAETVHESGPPNWCLPAAVLPAVACAAEVITASATPRNFSPAPLQAMDGGRGPRTGSPRPAHSLTPQLVESPRHGGCRRGPESVDACVYRHPPQGESSRAAASSRSARNSANPARPGAPARRSQRRALWSA